MPLLSEKYKLSQSGVDFINEEHLHALLDRPADAGKVEAVIAKSMAKQPLSAEETAVLLAAREPEQVERIFAAARQLKRDVYGNRIVLFAPLYIGNECTNDCQYCAFRRTNRRQIRRTLDEEEIRQQVLSLEAKGHKRLILVFGEHPDYDAHFIADCVRHVYVTRSGPGEIRRVNLNAAPMDHEGYATVKAANIGTYQIFQETYHHATYRKIHPQDTRKGDYLWRLDGVARAMEAECDDVGIGALFGLYDWRFEVLSLVSHALHLQQNYGVGPHTISFPRLRPAQGVDARREASGSGRRFQAAGGRFAAGGALHRPDLHRPRTAGIAPRGDGLRRLANRRRLALEIGGYTELGDAQVMEREQFELGDIRSLDETMRELLVDGYIPSFCTSCYRLGRTGEQFMEFAIPGFIQNLCTPNALSNLAGIFDRLRLARDPRGGRAGDRNRNRQIA